MFCLHSVRSQGLGHICTLSLPSTTNIIYISLGFPVLQDVLPQSPKPVTVCVTYVEHHLFISWPHPTPWSPAIALCPAETITANYCGNAIKVQKYKTFSIFFFLLVGPADHLRRRLIEFHANKFNTQNTKLFSHSL